MSATYIGYLVKLPKKLATAQARTAVKARLGRLRVLRKNFKDPEYVWDDDMKDLDLDQQWSTREAEDWCAFWDELDQTQILLKYIFTEPVDGGDCQIRNDPDNPNARWLACGSMTWGDDPDSDTYEWLSTLDKLGLFDVLGIR